MTQKIGQGGTIPLDAEYTDGTGSLVDPGTPLVDVIDPDDVVVLADQVPVRQSVGRYVFEHDVAVDASLGLWTARWTGSVNGVPVEADDHFEVVAAGSVEFDQDRIIGVDDLKEYLSLSSLSAAQTTAASAIIDGLHDDLEAHLKRPITIRRFTESPTIRAGKVVLRNTPVVEIESFTVDAVAVAATDYEVVSWGVKDLVGYTLGSPLVSTPVVEITYRAGLDGSNPADPFTKAARAKMLRAAAREFNQVVREDAAGASRISVEGTSIAFVGEGGWLDAELAALDRWKRRVAR